MNQKEKIRLLAKYFAGKIRLDADRDNDMLFKLDDTAKAVYEKHRIKKGFEEARILSNEAVIKKVLFKRNGFSQKNKISVSGNKKRNDKIVLDPDADGNQWIYKGMGIQKQEHPSLFPLACYDRERNEFLIGVCITKTGAKKLINEYLKNGRTATCFKMLHE